MNGSTWATTAEGRLPSQPGLISGRVPFVIDFDQIVTIDEHFEYLVYFLTEEVAIVSDII